MASVSIEQRLSVVVVLLTALLASGIGMYRFQAREADLRRLRTALGAARVPWNAQDELPLGNRRMKTVLVAGAGDPAYDGTYCEDGAGYAELHNGRPVYRKDASHVVYYTHDRHGTWLWVMSDAVRTPPGRYAYYYTLRPFMGQCGVFRGTAPAPTVTEDGTKGIASRR